VTVVGAAGGIGQPLSLLLKLSGKVRQSTGRNAFCSSNMPFSSSALILALHCLTSIAGATCSLLLLLLLLLLCCVEQQVDHLALYDIVGTPGVAADISHCNAKGKVTGHKGAGELDAALQVQAPFTNTVNGERKSCYADSVLVSA
jgi:hypothetical protein